MTSERLQQILSTFPQLRVAVIGDYFLDKYLECDPELAEVSLETGKTAHQVVQVRHSPGAAGNIVSNLIALGAGTVYAVGFTGDDGEGYELRKDLNSLGCCTQWLFTDEAQNTPVYLKPRVMGISGLDGERERYDTKNRSKLPNNLERKFIEALPHICSQVDAVIIADQVNEPEFGVITTNMRAAIIQQAQVHSDMLFWVDSRIRAGTFEHCTIKPNRQEAIWAAYQSDEPNASHQRVMEAGHLLAQRTGKPVFLTVSDEGMYVFSADGYEHVAGVAIHEPTDPTGAGDSATAGAVLAAAAGASGAEAALIGNLTASVTVQQIDTTGTASPASVCTHFAIWQSQHS